ncbi:hypothetical protein LINGRAHAP2_LOCUS10853 [Linum grandiflorum]
MLRHHLPLPLLMSQRNLWLILFLMLPVIWNLLLSPFLRWLMEFCTSHNLLLTLVLKS